MSDKCSQPGGLGGAKESFATIRLGIGGQQKSRPEKEEEEDEPRNQGTKTKTKSFNNDGTKGKIYNNVTIASQVEHTKTPASGNSQN